MDEPEGGPKAKNEELEEYGNRLVNAEESEENSEIVGHCDGDEIVR